ncbi:fatty-acid amide hydrolase 2-A-like [Onthophagus taurus]|uniref:fatty-acid amide hydrolase 2-A-like n=1 Tax=Onthophagus taurus TaxID=166361 RepID=UPI000C2078C7|nr:fatty-acid amide hydrolase 2-A-like [Onthophagus taurus]
MGLIYRVYALICTIIDHLIYCGFGLYFNSKRKYIPSVSNKILLESATSLALKIRNKEIKSFYVVESFINRIKEVNPILNAVVDERFNEALKEAKRIDENIANGAISQEEFNKKPFLGVPFTTKETTACEGLSWSFGIICRRHIKSTFDATIIELIKNSGGILLAVTNVPQLNLWTETYNPIYGVTNNPYNTTKNVGGSSGGEASLIAACGSPFGLGTDIAGSIRIPCFRCGIFGHKTSSDIITTKGLTFREGTEGPTMVVSGPMTKHAQDLLPLLKVLVGKSDKLSLDVKVEMKKIKIFYISEIESFLSSPIGLEIKYAIKRCVQHFEEICEKKPEEIELKNLECGFKLWSYMMTKEKSDFKSDIMNRKDEAFWLGELFKYFLGKSKFNFYTIMNLINGKLPKPKPEWGEKVLNDLKQNLIALLGTNSVLLFPSEAFAANYHYTSTLRPYNITHYALWSALKFPVTQVPLGLNAEGMPIGVQVVGAPYQDHLTIAVAVELEKVFGGYVAPFQIN